MFNLVKFHYGLMLICGGMSLICIFIAMLGQKDLAKERNMILYALYFLLILLGLLVWFR